MELSLSAVGSDPADAHSPVTAKSLVQHILSTTSCYDLMQTSSKGTIFETTIPFQLAFFALIEHDTDVAPLWDPELRSFVGLMVVQDYITAMRLCMAHNQAVAPGSGSASASASINQEPINALEVTSKPISEILLTIPGLFSNQGFHSVDVDDSLLQLYSLMGSSQNDYVPVMDPDSGALVSILGALDLVHLLNQIAKNHPALFGGTVRALGAGTFRDVLTMTKNAQICDVLNALHQHGLSAVPIVDDLGRAMGVYHKSDVAFIMKAQDPEGVLNNLKIFRVEHSLLLKEQLLASGELITNTQGLATVKMGDSVLAAINAMEMSRTTRVVVVDDSRVVLGVVSVRDLLYHYLEVAPAAPSPPPAPAAAAPR